MVEDCNLIRASLLLLAGRKQNVDLPLFLLCVCLLFFRKVFEHPWFWIEKFGWSSIVGNYADFPG